LVQVDTLTRTDSTPAQVLMQRRLFLVAGDAPRQRRYEQTIEAYLTTDLRLRNATATTVGPDGLAQWRVAVERDTLFSEWYQGTDTSRAATALDTVPVPVEMVPLWITTFGGPRVGATVTLPVVDLGSLARRRETWTAVAESTVHLADSVVRRADRTVEVLTVDTVRAWRFTGTDRSVTMHQLVEANGFVVRRWTGGGLSFERDIFEYAFERWQQASDSVTGRSPLQPPPPAEAAAVVRAVASDAAFLLPGAEYPALEAEGPTQRIAGDTVETYRPSSWRGRMAFRTVAPLPMTGGRFAPHLVDEPFLSPDDSALSALAVRLRGASVNAREVGTAIHNWIRSNIDTAPPASFGTRPAAVVLATRRGSPEERALLGVALARRVGLPARVVGGVLRTRTGMRAHTWYEIFIGDWIGVDPAERDISASPGHIRLVTGASGGWADLLALAGALIATGTDPVPLP
jgi:transglutaminase-like putative cysteine protease